MKTAITIYSSCIAVGGKMLRILAGDLVKAGKLDLVNIMVAPDQSGIKYACQMFNLDTPWYSDMPTGSYCTLTDGKFKHNKWNDPCCNLDNTNCTITGRTATGPIPLPPEKCTIAFHATTEGSSGLCTGGLSGDELTASEKLKLSISGLRGILFWALGTPGKHTGSANIACLDKFKTFYDNVIDA